MRPHHRLGALVLSFVPIVGLLIGLAASPALEVDRIIIVAPSAELGEDVRQQLRVPPGASILLYPLAQITQDVRRAYRIKDIAVDRVSPHQIQIKVTARTPFVALSESESYLIVSREGVCLQRVPEPGKLPVVTGLAPQPMEPGGVVDAQRLQWAAEIIAGATKVGLREGLQVDLSQLNQISVKEPGGLQATLGNVNHLTRKMTILGRLLDQLRAENKQVISIDLSAPDLPLWKVGEAPAPSDTAAAAATVPETAGKSAKRGETSKLAGQ